MTRTPRLAVVAFLLAAACVFLPPPSSALANGEVAAAVDVRIQALEREEDLSRTQKKCLRALKQARDILLLRDEERVERIKQLRQVIAALKRWLDFRRGLSFGLDDALDTEQIDLANAGVGIRSVIQGIEDQKLVRRLEKLLKKAQKKIGQAAEAGAAGNRKKQAGKLLGAARQVAKAEAMLPEEPGPGAGDARCFAYVANDLSGVAQVWVIDFTPGATTGPGARQITFAGTSASAVQTGEVDGRMLATFIRDGDLFVVDVKAPGAVPTNLTEDVPDLSTGSYDVSSRGGYVIQQTVLDQQEYLIRLDGSGNHALGRQSGSVRFLQDGVRFLLQSFEPGELSGNRLDLFTPGDEAPAAAPIAGPTVDGTSTSFPTVSPGEGFVAYFARTLGELGNRLVVTRLGASGPDVAAELGVDARSTLDRSFRQIAGAWGAEDAGGTCFLWEDAAGDTQLAEISYDEAVDRVVGSLSDGLTIEEVQGIGQVLVDAQRDIVVVGRGFRRAHVDTQERVVTPFGRAGDEFRSIACDEAARVVLYADARPERSDEVRAYDLDTRTDTGIGISDFDLLEEGVARIDDLSIRSAGENQVFLYFAVEGGSGIAGLWGMLLDLAQPLSIEPLFPTERLIEERPGDRLIGYWPGPEDGAQSPEDLFVAAFFRASVVQPGQLVFGGAMRSGDELVAWPPTPAVDAEGIPLGFDRRF